ncbi:MAG: hypothetical protein M1827_004626 [Pycnora praestabilis]|nr:MAG: hypothetical protein M1827_004626 [Pycnora praestabilis]
MAFTSRPTPAVFPLYLLPSFPFRRRKSSTDSTDSNSSTSPPEGASSPEVYLSGHASYLRCARCATDLCMTSQIISKGFTGRHGRAYLVAGPSSENTPTISVTSSSPTGSLPNTHTHKAVPRQLVTGAHTVSDVSCALCGTVLGWKYVAAEEESQRYKVGKFILETKRINSAACWEGRGDDPLPMPPVGDLDRVARANEEEDVEFDSQDEDECEDLFAGVWSPALAMRRRRGRRFGSRIGGMERAKSEGVM